MSHANIETRQRIEPNFKLAEPPMFKVVYLNDDVTSVEFVISSLIDTFDYEVENAVTITQTIHDAGAAIVAVLPYEIAEQKGIEVSLNARAQGFPLQIRVEAEA